VKPRESSDPINWKSVRAIAFDFDGVFTDNRVWISETGEESVVCSRSDGLGTGLLHDFRIYMIIISKETNPVVAMRGRKHSLQVIQGCDEKLPRFKEWLDQIGVSAENSAYVGNDINDLDCMMHASIAITPSDSHPEILSIADFVTSKPGGNGAIREVADLIFSKRMTR
jgi:N-acylneuraminate cytidylyltransferase